MIRQRFRLFLCMSVLALCLSGRFSPLAYAAETNDVDIPGIVESVVGDEQSSTKRAQLLSRWLNENFEWTYTDYQKRTVEEIIARKGGNCAEQARVLTALFDEAGIKSRWVAEINIHPKSERRRIKAAELITQNDYGFSVFGYMHNDHRWLEILDDSTGEWNPVDPTLGIFGIDQWINSRMGFGERPEVAKDMLVPFVVVIRDKRKLVEDRTEHYLIDEFNSCYANSLSKLASWPNWTGKIKELSKAGIGAFAAEVNLHDYTSQMAELEETYKQLKAEYLESIQRRE